MIDSKSDTVGQLNRYVNILIVAWTLLILVIISLDIYNSRKHSLEMAQDEARVHFDWMVMFREWAASHGGVYVPLSKDTPSNEYLNVKDRDITTPSGKKLTLMNPAYMSRQIFEKYAGKIGVIGHLTSLKLIRPENKPDNWETMALKSFEQGVSYKSEVKDINNEPYLRHMRPIFIKQVCLKCHAFQGYKVGDVRGGISISVPMTPILNRVLYGNILHTLFFGTLWGIGVFGILFSARRIRHSINKRENALTSLRETQARISAILKAVGEGIIVIGEDSRIHFVNQQMLKIFGYKMDEILGQEVTMLMPERYRERHNNGMKVYLAGGPTTLIGARHEFEGLRKDGSVFPIEIIVEETVLSEKNKLYTASIRDITDRKSTEKQLTRSSALLKAVIEQAPFGVVIGEGAPDNWKVSTVNKVAQIITGMDEAEQRKLGMDQGKMLRPANMPWRMLNQDGSQIDILKSPLPLAMQGETTYNKEMIVERADGSQSMILCNAIPIYNHQHEVIAGIVTFPDITERKKTEVERKRLSTAIEQAADIFVITDTSGTILYVNPAFERAYGYTREEAIGQNPHILKSGKHDVSYYKNIWDIISSGKTWTGRFVNKKKDGGIIEESATIAPVLDKEGSISGYVAIKRDITKEAVFANAKEFFAAATAHELRTPMTTLEIVKSYFDTIDGGTDEESIKRFEHAKVALNDSFSHLDRVLLLTSTLSDLNKPKIMKAFGPGFLHMIITSLVDSTRVTLEKEKRILDFHVKVEPEFTNSEASLHQDTFTMAYEECITNAVKYTPDGKNIYIHAYVDGDFLTIEIRDEGVGIPKDMLNEVTEPFFSIQDPLTHSSGRHKYMGGGIGLGLTITRMKLHLHGGTLNVQSEGVNMATAVTLRLPASKPVEKSG